MRGETDEQADYAAEILNETNQSPMAPPLSVLAPRYCQFWNQNKLAFTPSGDKGCFGTVSPGFHPGANPHSREHPHPGKTSPSGENIPIRGKHPHPGKTSPSGIKVVLSKKEYHEAWGNGRISEKEYEHCGKALEKMLKALPPMDLVICKGVMEGKTFEEIGTLIGMQKSGVRKRLMRTIRSIAVKFGFVNRAEMEGGDAE